MRARWFTGLFLALGALVLFPAIAYAHHCHTAEHCFETGQPASAFNVLVGAFLFVSLSIVLDFYPPTSFARGLVGAVTGRDPWAWFYEVSTGLKAPGGSELGTWERIVGVVPISKVPKTWKTGSRYVDEAIGTWNEMEPSLDVLSKAASVGGNVTSLIGTLTGLDNYPVRGGGEQLRADGIREDDWYLQETKYGGSSENSPFRDDSRTPSPVRDKIRQQAEDEVYKYGRVIKDPDSPYQGLEYVTNEEGAKRFYEDLFLKHDVPGRVRVEEP